MSRGGLKYSNGTVMNDGCARISMMAAKAICEKLGIEDYLPSAFQGRIGGAKGVWIVSDDGNVPDGRSNGDFWIEISTLQEKFTPAAADAKGLSFEVCDYSKPLRSAFLNKQFLRILFDRGVPFRVLLDLVENSVDEQTKKQMEAMADPRSFRKWSQENGMTLREREA